MKKIIVPIALFTLFLGCQKKEEEKETVANTTTSSTPAPSTTAPVAPAAETRTYISIVDDLRVRETPSMDGKVITTLKQGAKMTQTGKTSPSKFTINLRGKEQTDYFYEILTAENQKGWVFGGAIAQEGNAAATNNLHTTYTDDAWSVTENKVGAIHAASTEAQLIQAYGKENIRPEKEIYANADVPPFKGISIFKGKPDEVLVAWDNEKKGKVAMVFIRNEGGKWHTIQGVKVGTPLHELQKINEKPFTFNGFGWDFGGYITDWNGGKLQDKRVSIRLGVDTEVEFPSQYSGDRPVKSSEAGLAKFPVKVEELSVSLD